MTFELARPEWLVLLVANVAIWLWTRPRPDTGIMLARPTGSSTGRHNRPFASVLDWLPVSLRLA